MVSERVSYPYQERAGVATPLNHSRIKQISQGIGRGEDIEVQSSDHNARDCTPSFFADGRRGVAHLRMQWGRGLRLISGCGFRTWRVRRRMAAAAVYSERATRGSRAKRVGCQTCGVPSRRDFFFCVWFCSRRSTKLKLPLSHGYGRVRRDGALRYTVASGCSNSDG